MRINLGLVAGLIMLNAISMPAQQACVSRFNNRSNFEWSISGASGDKSNIVVPPNSVVDIPWTNPTSIVISGKIPNRPYARQFTVQPANGCYVIVRQGNAGNVLINKPEAGSVTTCVGNC